MIWYTLGQAAERVNRDPETVRRWVRTGLLAAVKNPIDGKRYVREDHLLDVERDARRAQRLTRMAHSA